MGYEYDEAVLKCFLKQQDRLFPEPVAEGMEGSDLHLVQAAPAWQCLADSLCQLVRCLVCKGDGRNLRRFYAPLAHKVFDARHQSLCFASTRTGYDGCYREYGFHGLLLVPVQGRGGIGNSQDI